MSVSCPGNQNRFQSGLISANELNIIATITLPSLSENLVAVEILHDIDLPRPTQVRRLDRGMFIPQFGVADIASLVDSADIDTNQAFNLDPTVIERANLNREGLTVLDVNYCISENLRDFATFRANYNVRDLVCNIDGQQAISASWFPLVEEGYDNFDLAFKIPIGENGFEPGFRPEFTPDLDNVVFEETDTDLTIFLPYSNEAVGLNDDENDVNIFLFLGRNFFENASDCIIFDQEEQLNLAPLIAVALPFIACACLLVVVAINRFSDNNAGRNRGGIMGRLNFFPGNPDIIVAPNEDEAQVVQAVLEEDDNQDLDAAVPVTTINVRMEENL